MLKYEKKKKTIVDENLIFENRWIEGCSFICIKEAAVFIIYNENIPVLKGHYIKKYYEMKSASKLSGIIQSQLRRDEIIQRQNSLAPQQISLKFQIYNQMFQ
jgi:hypothetical protein